MAEYPYLIIVSFALGAGGTGSPNFPVPANEEYHIKTIFFVSTGAFDITGIRDSQSNQFSNVSVGNPILSTMIQNAASPNISFKDFPLDLVIKGTMQIFIDLLDTSGAPNTVRLLLPAVRVVPGA